MSPKRIAVSHHDLECSRANAQFAGRSWCGRLALELTHRFRLALFAPTLRRSLSIERERAQAERERMAEEYARGYLDGWHECYAACLEAVEESASERRDIWAAGELLAGFGESQKTN